MLIIVAGCGGPAKTRVDLKQEAISFNEAGYQYYRQSRWNLAQEKFEQALAYNRLIDRRSGIASNLNNLGAIDQAQGDLDRAVRHFQEALAVNRELNDSGRHLRDPEQSGSGVSVPGPSPGGPGRLPGSPGSGPAASPRGRSWP